MYRDELQSVLGFQLSIKIVSWITYNNNFDFIWNGSSLVDLSDSDISTLCTKCLCLYTKPPLLLLKVYHRRHCHDLLLTRLGSLTCQSSQFILWVQCPIVMLSKTLVTKAINSSLEPNSRGNIGFEYPFQFKFRNLQQKKVSAGCVPEVIFSLIVWVGNKAPRGATAVLRLLLLNQLLCPVLGFYTSKEIPKIWKDLRKLMSKNGSGSEKHTFTIVSLKVQRRVEDSLPAPMWGRFLTVSWFFRARCARSNSSSKGVLAKLW